MLLIHASGSSLEEVEVERLREHKDRFPEEGRSRGNKGGAATRSNIRAVEVTREAVDHPFPGINGCAH